MIGRKHTRNIKSYGKKKQTFKQQDKIKDEKEYESDKKTHELELDDFEDEEIDVEENVETTENVEDSDHVLDEQLQASYDAVDDSIDLSNVEVDPDDFLDTVDLDALDDLDDIDK